MSNEPDFGVMLPHFAQDSTPELIVEAAVKAEELGFDSVWVRDHVFIPEEHREHGGIKEDQFVEPLLTLATVNGATEDLTLGTSILTPLRHPLKLAQNISSLSYLSGGNLITGMGLGSHKGEFEAMDKPFDRRPELVEENFEILRRMFTEEKVTFDGEFFSFQDVTIDPQPVGDAPLWYGGESINALRRAFEIADGWLPGPMPYAEIDRKMGIFDNFVDEFGREISKGIAPKFSVAKDNEEAVGKFNMDMLINMADSYLPGTYETADEIKGLYVAGTPEESAAQLQPLVDAGMDQIILDMRHEFSGMIEMMELTADSVLPNID